MSTTTKSIAYAHQIPDTIYNLLPEREWATGEAKINAANAANAQQGKVGVYHRDGWLVLRYKGREEKHRGNSVDGCSYDDEFVQHLAAKFKASIDA